MPDIPLPPPITQPETRLTTIPIHPLQTTSHEPDKSLITTPPSDFETDLQEIMSDTSMILAIAFPTPLLILPPTTTSPASPPPITFSTMPSDSQFVVALTANIPISRRQSPFKHKSIRKRPLLPSPLSITTPNPFSALDPDHSDTSLSSPCPSADWTLEPPTSPSHATPFEGPLLDQGVSAPLSL